MPECSECKHEVAKLATRCPRCGHQLPEGQRRKFQIVGAAFAVFGLLLPRLFPSTSLTSASSDDMERSMLMILLGGILVLYARFSSKFRN